MRASEPRLAAVFQRIDITPSYPVSLLGYFNDRVSTGVADPLACRLAAFAARSPLSAARLLIVQIDTCLFDDAFAWTLRRALRARANGAWTEVLVFASHTHTAPALARLYETPRQDRYAADLVSRIAAAAGEVARALAAGSPATTQQGPNARMGDSARAAQGLRAVPVTLSVARGRAEGLSFNRRWLGRDGRAVTNPSRALRAELAGPEGSVDPEVITLLFREEGGAPRAVFVSAVNHTDTVGGQQLSADWPGLLEREVVRGLGAEVPVFFLPGAQGNINHFDPAVEGEQTGYAEARRLGKAYAQVVLDSLPAARSLALDPRLPPLASRLDRVRLPGRRIPAAKLDAARRLLRASGGEGVAGTLTASELAAGSPAVERVLARELLRQSPSRRRSYRVPLQAVRLGGVLLCGIPGEPFVELGLALKGAAGTSGSCLVLPLGLAGGYFGYLLPGDRLASGGYEALPVAGRLGGAAAAMIVEHFRRLV